MSNPSNPPVKRRCPGCANVLLCSAVVADQAVACPVCGTTVGVDAAIGEPVAMALALDEPRLHQSRVAVTRRLSTETLALYGLIALIAVAMAGYAIYRAETFSPPPTAAAPTPDPAPAIDSAERPRSALPDSPHRIGRGKRQVAAATGDEPVVEHVVEPPAPAVDPAKAFESGSAFEGMNPAGRLRMGGTFGAPAAERRPGRMPRRAPNPDPKGRPNAPDPSFQTKGQPDQADPSFDTKAKKKS